MSLDCLDTEGSRKMNVGKTRLTYHQDGDGELLVLLPPPLADSKIFCDLQHQLSPYLRTVSLDLPLEDDLKEVLEMLIAAIKKGTTERFHLVGTSISAWIALLLIPRLGSQVKSVIMVNGIHDTTGFGRSYQIGLKGTKFIPGKRFRKDVFHKTSFLRKGVKQKEILENYFRKRIKVLDKEGIRLQMSWFVTSKIRPPKIDIPVLYLGSTRDPIVSSSDRENLRGYSHEVKIILIDTDAHLLFLSHPDQVLQHIRDFVEFQ